MTIEAARRRSTRAGRRGEPEDLPIGEVDANIFNCPACARPLGIGTSRCPGCSTRLVAGVRASRAAGFIAVGALAGVIVGSLATGVTAAVLVSSTPAVAVTGADVPPATTDQPVASAPVPVVVPAVPASALSALRQSSMLNERLLADAGKLDAALSLASPSSVEIARVLRSLSASATFGDRIAPTVADWTEAAPLSIDLVAFYAAVGAVARDGLSASLTNDRAYVNAGRTMRTLLDSLPALDARAGELVAAATTTP
jgi:hypothetical protein